MTKYIDPLIMGIKIDVDTYIGMKEGVPALRRLLKELNLKATFFISMGPDNSGKAIKRIFKKGFIKKMLRTSPASNYGIKTMLYGTILKAPIIAESFKDEILRLKDDGHEIGVHCYDHAKWQNELSTLSEEEILEELKKAFGIFENILKYPAKSFAAPGWIMNEASFSAVDKFNLDYISATRGCSPYLPTMNGKISKTLEVPTTLQTLDEMNLRKDLDEQTQGLLKTAMNQDFSVFTAHAEMEGRNHLKWFKKFLTTISETKKIVPLTETVKSLSHGKTPHCEVILGEIKGRSGFLACQKI